MNVPERVVAPRSVSLSACMYNVMYVHRMCLSKELLLHAQAYIYIPVYL